MLVQREKRLIIRGLSKTKGRSLGRRMQFPEGLQGRALPRGRPSGREGFPDLTASFAVFSKQRLRNVERDGADLSCQEEARHLKMEPT